METVHWGRIEELFHQAADLGPADRAAFLDQACGSDKELRHEVESLLAVDAADNEFLQAAVDHIVERLPAIAEEASGLIGKRIGHYLITSLIGKGGMGAVYSAVRADDFFMHVAIKLLKRGTDTETALSRFRSERQILAELQHPNIARLLDGGATDWGLPYLVMEYVDGMPLLEFTAQISVRRRVELFRSVCSAVQYAHQHHIVHRDIKPANIVVTRDGVPKLLDFGIAKLLEPSYEVTSATTSTAAGMRAMTPDYASPEQVRGDPITPATDIYSLGAVLYELLTGERAHHVTTCSPSEIEKEICTHEPKLPSSVVKNLDRDLDNIVMQALRKEPERRYGSVQELADDLNRFLHDLPVKARPESFLYRTRKYLKRNGQKIALAAIPITLLLLWLEGRHWFELQPPPLTGSIVLADFANKTGDPAFDGSLREALSLKLAESPSLDILSDQQVSRTLRMMGRKPTEHVTPQVGLEVCERNGLQAVISGSISQLGNQYIIQVDATSCKTGESVGHTGAEIAGKDKVLNGLGNLTIDLRRKLGESLGSLQRFDKPFEATSSSLEALQAFTLARKARQQGRLKDECVLLLRAVELDPNFAYGYASLSAEYYNLGQTERAAEYGRKAFELRDRVTEREKFYLVDKYYGTVTGQLAERIESDKLWTLTYPRDSLGFANLATAYARVGQNEKALEASLEAIRLNPTGVVSSYVNAMGCYAALGRFDEAKGIYEQAKTKISYRHLPVYYYDIAFVRHDTAGMAAAVKEAMAMEGAEYEILFEQALVEAYHGRLRQSRQLFSRAIESAQRADDRTRAATAYVSLGHIEALFGFVGPARQHANQALGLSSGRDVLFLAGDTLALSREWKHAEVIEQELVHKFPLNTIVNHVYLPAIDADIETAQHQPFRAIERLKSAIPYELASMSGTMVMYAVYARGNAYLAVPQGSEAEAEFEKIADNPGIIMNSPVGALAQLGLAHSYSAAGGLQQSRMAYEGFFDLWRDADPDIPVLVEARHEYEKVAARHTLR